MKVKTMVKAGKLAANENQTVVKPTRKKGSR